MAKKKARASNHTKLYGLCENKCLVEVMSKEESNQKFSDVDGKFTETNQKITQTLNDAKDYTDTKTTEVKNIISNTITPQITNKADKNLGNVANSDFLNKMKASGFSLDGYKIKSITPRLVTGHSYPSDGQVDDKTYSINETFGIFIYLGHYLNLYQINGKDGSYYKIMNDNKGFTAQNYIENESSSMIHTGILIFTKEFIIYFNFRNYVYPILTNFTSDKLTSLRVYRKDRDTSNTFSFFKIADLIKG